VEETEDIKLPPFVYNYKCKPCQDCGLEFQPRGPSSHRCDRCSKANALKTKRAYGMAHRKTHQALELKPEEVEARKKMVNAKSKTTRIELRGVPREANAQAAIDLLLEEVRLIKNRLGLLEVKACIF
jgi:hypothetical protein